MIDANSVVVGTAPRITAAKFAQILAAANSPASGEAARCYAAIVAEGVDPTFALAIFKSESQFATDPNSIVVKFSTFNPGNTRSSTIGPMPLITTDRGVFVKFDSWEIGFRDLAHRLVAKDYVYAQEGRTTIAKIIERWAPKGDQNNDPASYVARVVSFMNKWISSSVGSSNMEIIDLSNNTPNSVYTDRGMAISELILHDTAGSSDDNKASPDACQAALNATIRWFQGPGGVSIHYLIGPENLGGKIYRLCKEQFAAYHAIGNKGSINGVSKDNRIAIGIERFGQPDEGVGPNQRAAMLWLVADICSRNNLPPGAIISHMSIQSDRRDGNVLLQVSREAVANGGTSHVTNNTNNQGPVPAALPYGVTVDQAGALIFPGNIPLNHGFKDSLLTLFGNVPVGDDLGAAIIRGVKQYGLPIKPEAVTPEGAEQEFENCFFAWNKNEAPDWQLRLSKKSKAA